MDLDRILNHDGQNKTKRPHLMSTTSKCVALRVGKWTHEEEAYAFDLIKAFLTGMLDIPEGTSLRLFLAKKLCCSPMRVTTKLSTNQLNGQRIRKRLGQLRYFPCPYGVIRGKITRLQSLEELGARFRTRENIPDCVKEESHTTSGKISELLSKTPVRIGSWTNEEEAYAHALITAFRSGVLDINAGTTLRSFLAEQLCCDRMRITKKLSYGIVSQYQIPTRLGCLRYRRLAEVHPEQASQMLAELDRLRSSCFAINQVVITPKSRPHAYSHSTTARCSRISYPVKKLLEDTCNEYRYPLHV
uniref:Uncharacterized protein AlNc14C200G8657 n=1 Tax=Albugo laibachii Nc14 TaxID=890382 RepID=F0WQI7_9STRA|nr:conserved hypothetical protein [Albugo laibachii Nc14]CCA24169.1 conserved hypothetical protein [Albugo laibachii Nc14]|eukprot:CCA24169.1 conserved hypothetical protein [Albugo laibachii Nc14]